MLFYWAMSNLDIKVRIYKLSTTSTISSNTSNTTYTNTNTSHCTLHVCCIVWTTAFSMAWSKIVMQWYTMESHLSIVFSWYTHSTKGLCVYWENTVDLKIFYGIPFKSIAKLDSIYWFHCPHQLSLYTGCKM